MAAPWTPLESNPSVINPVRCLGGVVASTRTQSNLILPPFLDDRKNGSEWREDCRCVVL